MLDAAKAALQKAGFTIESLRNRIKGLEAENAKLKEPKTCSECDCYLVRADMCIISQMGDVPKRIQMSGCGKFEPKAP